MRVLLIRYYSDKVVNTPMPRSVIKVEGISPPLGLAYIAAFLEQEGHSVKILDCIALGLSASDAEKEIAQIKPDIVGVTCTTPNVPGVIEISQIAKRANPDVPIVVGGPHLSIFPTESVSFPFIDFGVMGEGEHTFAELVDAIDAGQKEYGHITGLVWKRNGKVIVNPQREPNRDLDALPFPARHLLPMDRYHLVIMQHPIATMIASRGCAYHCAYCFKEPHARIYRMRSPKNVVDEMEVCVNKYKAKEISIYDDCWPNRRFLEGICEEIISRKLDVRWNALQRVDLVTRENLTLMKKAGCVLIKYGVESGSERILRLMEKHITRKQVEDAFKLTKDVGIKTFAFFMAGYPTETREEFRATVEFAKKIDPDWIVLDSTIPFPGTKLWSYAVENMGFDADYWREWSLGKRKEALPPLVPGVDKLCRDALREFYMRPKIIGRKLMGIRQIEDVKKYVRGGFELLKFSGRDESY